ncbi:MAG: YceI family protein, partial [Myxococcota bacterium]
MTVRNPAFATLALLFAVGCVEDVGKDKVAAEVAEPAAAVAPVTGRELAIDTAKSSVRALGAKITAKHPIEFDRWTGALRVAEGKLTGVDVTIQMDSLRADVDDLTSHLKNEDFFDVARFPTATFRSSGVVPKAGPDGATHEITGALTLHGVTKTVRFPASVAAQGDGLAAKAEFVIDRQDFGVSYPGRPDDLIQ